MREIKTLNDILVRTATQRYGSYQTNMLPTITQELVPE